MHWNRIIFASPFRTRAHCDLCTRAQKFFMFIGARTHRIFCSTASLHGFSLFFFFFLSFFRFLVNGYSCRKALFLLIITSHNLENQSGWITYKWKEKKKNINNNTSAQSLGEKRKSFLFSIYSILYFFFWVCDNHVHYNILFGNIYLLNLGEKEIFPPKYQNKFVLETTVTTVATLGDVSNHWIRSVSAKIIKSSSVF